MAKRKAKPSAGTAARRAVGVSPAAGLRLEIESVGERKNYNFQPGVSPYGLWPFSTIEWVADGNRYRARAMVQHMTTRNIVAFNSWHQDFSDAERAIALLVDSLNGTGDRRVYNIFGEIIELHTSDIGGGSLVQVAEVQALIWSMQEA
jgi:hypothetical protein